ncbi:GNAT family N-acetyltransferase [Puia sp.]|jgi:hypothetical protein|uniref:GNAT family N-acetyltransferase n=1 Tax=Puia sp. TaxID=2045100 RepID=UPI002F414B38
MSTGPHIRYLKRQEIDINRWDDCVQRSANRLVYGFHFYLDAITAGQWDALVLEDYQAVMPLTWRRKWGIGYCCQPAFTQQTGIFSPATIIPETVDAFLVALTRHYRFAEIYLNYGNAHPALRVHENLVLPLDDPYPQLEARYKKDLLRNLRLAANTGLGYTQDLDTDTAIEIYRSHYARRHPAIRPEDYTRFRRLCLHLQANDQLILRAAVKDGQMLATALLVRDASRLYLIQSATLPAGRKVEANHFLIDQLIREFAGTGHVLDFEGSDLPGIAYFYTNFGAVRQPYFFHRHNLLPWPWRLLKT